MASLSITMEARAEKPGIRLNPVADLDAALVPNDVGSEASVEPGQMPLGEEDCSEVALVCGVSPRLFGTIICILGVLWLSPDTLLIRLTGESGANIWVIAFWRMIFFSGFVLVAQVFRRGFRLDKALSRAGRVGVAAGVMWGIGTNCFTISLNYTKVANTLVIFASNPLWTALFSWLFLRERIPRHTAIAIVLGFGGIAVVLGGVISAPVGDQWKGDLLALAAAIITSFFFVSARFLRGEMLPSLLVGGLTGAVFTLFFHQDMAAVPTPMEWLFLWVQGFAVMGISFALLSLGPRYIPAAEVALLMLLETVIGPVWVFLQFGEQPSTFT